MNYTLSTTDFQSIILTSSEWMIFMIATAVIVLGTFMIYKFYNNLPDKPKKSVLIKIDRNGKHRYEIKEDLDNGRTLFWVKVFFFIVALGILYIPFHNWFYKS